MSLKSWSSTQYSHNRLLRNYQLLRNWSEIWVLLLLSSVGSGTTRNVDYRMRSAAFKEWKNEWSVINYELKISSGIINSAWGYAPWGVGQKKLQ